MPQRYIICPWCHAEMEIRDQEGVEIDQCPNCFGVWLDQGELETLLKQSPEPDAPRDSSNRPSQVVPRAHLFEWF